MKIKVYLADWFYNMGIVGFRRILKFQEDYRSLKLSDFEYQEADNYIEFNPDLLKEFHNYYFDYFLGRYNMARFQSIQLDKYLNLSKKEGKFNESIKVIKDIVKANNNKIKKIDETVFTKAEEIYKSLGDIKRQEQISELEELLLKYKDILELKNINEKITLNKFKSIMSNSFYGQVSFFNVIHTSKTIVEQKDIMFKDYISPIITMEELKTEINENRAGDLEERISKALSDKATPKNIGKLYKNINSKFIKKKKSLEEIEQYIGGKDFALCQMCGEYKSIGSEYGEGDFVPLAVSTDNSRNMFWNFNTSVPLCDICKLILICSAAGATDIFKGYMNANLDNKYKQYFAFVNMDTTFKDLYKTNESFNLKKDKENPFKELIFDIVSEAKERSTWQLQNILYVEFNSDYGSKNCKMNYFNIPKYIAQFFKAKAEVVNSIKDEKFKAEIVDDILSNKDIKFSIDRKLREVLANNYGNPYDCYRAVVIRYYLKVSKGGIKKMATEVDDKRLKFIYMRGLELNKHYTKNGGENKISSIAYRLLNAAKSNNKKEFMDTLIRIHLNAQMEVPTIFLDIMSEKELAFEEIAHSYVAGLISKASSKKDSEENEN
ncbi:CRISPR-associated cxxc_cxxc protein Cst1 [Clostridiales bacterium oral taxon 876 str. F0540]|nr:CRISPR-associated cxxc_cxxc protein Cst1 [Clostridiales bacterium oral taxon 876 str. F0540]